MSNKNSTSFSNISQKKDPPQTERKKHSSRRSRLNGRGSKDNNDAAASANSWQLESRSSQRTGLEPEEQKLPSRGKERGKEKEDEENLNMMVKDNSTAMVLEDPKSKERNVKELNERNEMLSDGGDVGVESNEMSTDAGEIGVESIEMSAIAAVKAEVDRLSDKVSALKADVSCGTKVSNKEFAVSTEMLIRQLLKLDNIEAEGEDRVHRKDEVRRVQDLMNTLDTLKARNSDPSKNNSNDVTSQNNNGVTSQNSNGFASQNGNVVSVTTKSETFDSGVDSLSTPTAMSSSTEVNQGLRDV